MDNLKTAYFAGLIDGEGSIGMQSRGTKVTSKRLAIKVNMTCEATVRALHEHFQVGWVTFRPRAKEHYKDQWQWRASDGNCDAVLQMIFPYLITKRQLVEEILNRPRYKRGRPPKK